MPPAAQTPSRISPQQLESELKLTGILRRGDRTERSRAAVAVRRSEIRVVEQIERLEPELERGRPGDLKPLRSRQVHLPEVRTAHAVAAGIAEWLARIGRRRDARLVEPVC